MRGKDRAEEKEWLVIVGSNNDHCGSGDRGPGTEYARVCTRMQKYTHLVLDRQRLD